MREGERVFRFFLLGGRGVWMWRYFVG